MQWYSTRSIKQKLMILFTATAAASLALAFLVMWTYELEAYRSTLKREMLTLGRMLADSSTAATAFEDTRAAREVINALRAEPRIDTGCIEANGRVLAVYRRDSKSRGCATLPAGQELRFSASRLEVSCPVLLKGEKVGTVYLGIDLSEMYDRLLLNAALALGVMFFSALFALALSSRLQRLISRPILHLTDVAVRVSQGDYSLRAESSSKDELGTLILQFNAMMDQVHNRDVALQQAQDELEMRVEERTRELQNEIAERKAVELDLIHAKMAAEESSRAKSTFLANMSHELRTPLNAIIGYSELLEEEAPDHGYEPIVRDLQRIQISARHLLALINDVLDLSKIEAGRMEVHMEAVPVAELVGQAEETIRPLASKNRNNFTVTIEDGTESVVVDPVKFSQSLLNLLSNACKFTEDGEISLTVQRRTGDTGDWICWSVQDTGIGIAPENMPKLFASFSQVDSSATRKYAGTGLGLAISQRFCQMMGGHISVDSELSRGSTFTIHIPAGHSSAG